jgi:general stress protein 26
VTPDQIEEQFMTARATNGAGEKLWEMIKDMRFAMLTSVDEGGILRSRPMATKQEGFDGVLWFFTRASSHKVFEIQKNQHVNLSYADPDDQNYVSVSGLAELVRDKGKAKELWNEYLKTWFPKGLDDPDLALLKVRVDQAEYWDSPSSAMVHAFGYAKALLTGEPPKMGENEKITLR